MIIHLIAPFRTHINLNSEIVSLNREEWVTSVNRALKRLNNSHIERVTASTVQSRSGFSKYTALNEDCETDFSSPALRIEFQTAQFIKKAKAFFSPYHHPSGEDDLTIEVEDVENVTLNVFDNTITIAHICLKLSFDKPLSNESACSLDKLTSSYMQSQIAEDLNPLIEEVRQLLLKVKVKPRERKVASFNAILSIDDFVIFDDMKTIKPSQWNQSLTPMLWCNRTILAETPSETASARIWAGCPDETDAENENEFIQVGNNLFTEAERVSVFVKTMIPLQYFYTLLDVLRDSQRRVYLDMSSTLSGEKLRHFEKRSHAVSSMTDMILTEIDDYFLGLQSERKTFATKIYDVFDIMRVTQNLKQRSGAVTDKLTRLIEERTDRWQRVLQLGIILIGGIQVFDFLLNTLWMAKTESHISADGIPGILDVASLLPADAILNGAMGLAVITAAVYAFRRRR